MIKTNVCDVVAKESKENNGVKNARREKRKLVARIAIEKNTWNRHNSSITHLFLG